MLEYPCSSIFKEVQSLRDMEMWTLLSENTYITIFLLHSLTVPSA